MSNNKYFEGYNARYASLLASAEMLALNQKNAQLQFQKTKTCIFDKSLTDISRYRKEGKYITPYHAGLLKKRKNNEKACPVFDICLQMAIQKQKNMQYMAKVYADSKSIAKRQNFNLMNEKMAYEEFVEEYLLNAFVNQDKAFVLDSHNEQVIKDLISYFTRQHDSNLNTKKGICLFGGIGTGKSTIMKLLSKFTIKHDLETRFDFVYMDDIYTDCDSSGLESLNAYKFRACVFDDIGMRAENNVNNYGTKINAYRELVRRQYNRFSRTIPSLSHYTTNIQYDNQNHTKELAKVFGGRELDRFREMCNFVPLLGNSRRC